MSSITSKDYPIITRQKLLSHFSMHHPWLNIHHIDICKLLANQFEDQPLAHLQKIAKYKEKQGKQITQFQIQAPHP